MFQRYSSPTTALRCFLKTVEFLILTHTLALRIPFASHEAATKILEANASRTADLQHWQPTKTRSNSLVMAFFLIFIPHVKKCLHEYFRTTLTSLLDLIILCRFFESSQEPSFSILISTHISQYYFTFADLIIRPL